jgi:hypothetical protein
VNQSLPEIGKGASGCIAHCCRFLENRVHALVRREGFAFLDADGGEESFGNERRSIADHSFSDFLRDGAKWAVRLYSQGGTGVWLSLQSPRRSCSAVS